MPLHSVLFARGVEAHLLCKTAVEEVCAFFAWQVALLDCVREQAAGPQHGDARIQAAHQLHSGPVVYEKCEAAAHCHCGGLGLAGVELYPAPDIRTPPPHLRTDLPVPE